jgi:hypothetical protein
MPRALSACVAVLALALCSSARADDDKEVTVMLNGGVGAFTGNAATSAGPTWGVRVDVRPLPVLGVELGYDGSHFDANGGALTRNGLDALLKGTIPLGTPLRPFVAAGLGVSHVSASALGYQSDTMEEVPLAAGIELLTGDVTAGFRATYRFLVDDQLSPALGNPGGLFDASLTLGGRF